MKKLAFLFSLVVVFSSCKKTKELLDIPFSFSTKNDFTLPKAANQEYNVPDSVVAIKTPDIANTIPGEFQKNNLDINKIKSLSIESIQLNIQSPPGQTFAFMKSVKVYFGTSGVGEVLVATKSNINTISPAPTSLSLDVAGADVAPYIKNATYYLRVETALVKTYTQDITVNSEIKFRAVANPLN